MKSEFWMMLIIALGYLFAIIVLGMSNGLHRFNPAWLIAGHTAVMMVISIYLAMWFLRIHRTLISLLRLLTGYKPEKAHPSLRGGLRWLRGIYEELGKENGNE